MVDNARTDLRRINHEQNNQYKRILAFIIFLIVTLIMITGTFLNPFFMKKQIRTSNNQAVIVRQVNGNFDNLADIIGANHEANANLLTVKQTQPIADHVIDYSLGLHWFKVNNVGLAKQILHDINLNIDEGSSSDAQQVEAKLKKQKNNAPYAVISAFNLNTVTLGANIAVMLFLVNIIIVVVTIISMLSLISDMRSRTTIKALVHDCMAAGMWAGFWMIVIFIVLALIPVVFNVESLATFGYLIEISSSIFLDNVVAGVIIYILCAIPWQITSADN
ncbi:hypothetical protein [Lactobacillus acetotolerans]|jgi:NADH:ubiquinone oxidoreductase subunit 3 (subunit A)|uniref:Uncharacterized protein n=1 Tax=Lactobacillus acetotolerans TaxID=1600 RepID=A0A0D6A1C8_9LACO|nr:hypothetical protein [Lactobacillus acetotolerans]MBN7276643.1 hypothetical protein [Lactobacillus acetotolerans]QGV05194.1 hypothetical protein GJR85_07260 [Lactobacillus acetotolerans]BAQ56541.1 conserved hypothetical protein [Lactobacillus acetotolerans]HBG90810.1 hypothetical protein [Lactobacillus acetotolerans]